MVKPEWMSNSRQHRGEGLGHGRASQGEARRHLHQRIPARCTALTCPQNRVRDRVDGPAGPLVLVAALAASVGDGEPVRLGRSASCCRRCPTCCGVLAGLLQDARFRGDLGSRSSEIAVAFADRGAARARRSDSFSARASPPTACSPRPASAAVDSEIDLPSRIHLRLRHRISAEGHLCRHARLLHRRSQRHRGRAFGARRAWSRRRAPSAPRRAQIYLRIYLPAMEPLIVEGLRMGLIFTRHRRAAGRDVRIAARDRPRHLCLGRDVQDAGIVCRRASDRRHDDRVCNELMRGIEDVPQIAPPGLPDDDRRQVCGRGRR